MNTYRIDKGRRGIAEHFLPVKVSICPRRNGSPVTGDISLGIVAREEYTRALTCRRRRDGP